MASKDRILRLKDETRQNILEAAMRIVKDEGWQALSMRKIADQIEYTAPIIYEYFANKEAILKELNRKGFILLGDKMEEARNLHPLPAAQLEAMWMAYWNFAFDHREMYQLMFGVSMNCCMVGGSPELERPYDLVTTAITELLQNKNPDEDEICRRYFTFWSVIHGLISINLVNKGRSDEINQMVLRDAITGIIRAMTG